MKIKGGELPADTGLLVFARRLGTDAPQSISAAVDARGRFAIEWLTAGDYELTVGLRLPAMDGGGPSSSRGVASKQIVRVTDNGELEVTLVYDLSAAAAPRGQQ